jgi:protein-S-isoprenylcysteine O-methyltransferase Ste14
LSPIEVMRLSAVYVPLVAAVCIGFFRRRRPRMFAACLLSVLWVLSTLLVLQRMNNVAGWWTFEPAPVVFVGMPLELYVGWTILWGIVPALAFSKLGLPEVLVLMGTLDVWAMPSLSLLFKLPRNWLIGEVLALALVLAPGFCLACWTLENSHLNRRATLQVILSGLLFLFLLPEVVFALRPGPGGSVWQPLFAWPPPFRQCALQVIFLLAVPGISAVFEFAERGFGTPIPYDPPRRLVTSGIYRYCSNPMQMSCAVVMMLWSGVLRNPWLALGASMSVVHSAGIAHWDENRDLAARFGESWRAYHRSISSWRVRWRPFHAGPPARLYIARSCAQCSAIREWIEHRAPIGLDLIDAETLPEGSIRRLRYDAGDGTAPVEGVAAFARALEHLNLAWAYCGITLRLPIVQECLQILMDVSGFGPRIIPGTCAPTRQ